MYMNAKLEAQMAVEYVINMAIIAQGVPTPASLRIGLGFPSDPVVISRAVDVIQLLNAKYLRKPFTMIEALRLVCELNDMPTLERKIAFEIANSLPIAQSGQSASSGD